MKIIAVAGASGSGKTTVAKNIQAYYQSKNVKALIISADDFYKKAELNSALEDRAKRNYDHPDSIEDTLLAQNVQALKAGKNIDKPLYDFATHTRKDETEEVSPPDVLIIEGILVLHFESLSNLIDLKIYVDAADDLCFIRRLLRDMDERGRDAQSVSNQYLSTVRPMFLQYVSPTKNHADIVLVNDSYDVIKKPAINMTEVYAELNKRLNETSTLKFSQSRFSLLPSIKKEQEEFKQQPVSNSPSLQSF